MGCFDATCSLSNTSIGFGEQCLMVILNDYGDIKIEEFILYIRSRLTRKKSRLSDIDAYKSRGINHGFKDGLFDYQIDYIEKGEELYGTYFPVHDIIIGEYDLYGSIDGYQYDDSKKYLLFHVWAVESMFDETIDELLNDKDNFLYMILSKLYLLRKLPILSETCIGSQHKCDEEINTMIKLNIKINEYLKTKLCLEN